jgi:hypothetical protein
VEHFGVWWAVTTLEAAPTAFVVLQLFQAVTFGPQEVIPTAVEHFARL